MCPFHSHEKVMHNFAKTYHFLVQAWGTMDLMVLVRSNTNENVCSRFVPVIYQTVFPFVDYRDGEKGTFRL